MPRTFLLCLFAAAVLPACGGETGEDADASVTSSGTGASSAGGGGEGGGLGGSGGTGAAGGAGGSGGDTGGSGGTGGDGGTGGAGGSPECGTPAECAATWEQTTADKFDDLVAGPTGELAAFLMAVPKGGDLHNHLSGAVYAETYLDWADQDGNYCVNTSTFSITQSGTCSGSTQAVPTSGTFYDNIVRAWSMEDFVPGAQSGHDHFFATFGKFGAVAGLHRYDSIADVAIRAADENELYVETMFNLGKNIGDLSAAKWTASAPSMTAADLPGLYNLIVNDPTFNTELQNDINVVNNATSGYRTALGCNDNSPPAACDVEVRFIAQVSRTGAKDIVFGQLISAFEMASQTDGIVAANLSSPEDDSTSIANYNVHMAMLDFLHEQYDGVSPLHITLHAGELTPEYLPVGSTANTFHIREAVETGHAERIGHGLDILSEVNSAQLLTEMHDLGVLVEVCLSSNVQILEVSGTDHPLAQYLLNEVPVALATDDQGVSRSSMAGEYMLAALDQQLGYRQLKTMARDSLEHAFLPGASLWTSVTDAEPVAACASTDTMGIGETPNAACQAFLDGSERARMQWKLEGNFRSFESQQ